MAASRRPSERRIQVRRTVNLEFGSVNELITEYVSNVSRSGVFIRSDSPLPVGTKVNLRFTVIVDDLETIEGLGQVVRCILPGGAEPAGMGVVFLELTDYSRHLIEQILIRR